VTPRGLVLAWLSAFALVLILALGPVAMVDRAARAQRGDIVVIGTSIMAYAVPATGTGTTSLLGDERPHIRIAWRRMTESQMLGQLEEAIDQRRALVLVEVNPFLFDFADRAYQRPCDGVAHMVRTHISDTQRRVPAAYRELAGREPTYAMTGEPPNLAAAHALKPERTSRIYPLALRAPCEEARLAAAVAQARAQGTRVVLVLPPRSPDGDRLLGTAAATELRNRATALATRIGVELIVPEGNWPNDEFVDTAHVNLAGRAHFLRDLRRWWATAQ
jgi:hypothetical protein